MSSDKIIKLEHGSGGRLSRQLVEEVIYPRLQNGSYRELSDATPLKLTPEAAMTTDTYVIDPPFFPGGDIGELAVYGTCNDLAVSGSRPAFLSLGLIIEEGFLINDLARVLDSISTAAAKAGVQVVTGDTKVVPAGKGGGLYINTAGIGERVYQGSLSPARINPGDLILISGPIGAHGIAVMAAREGLQAAAGLKSDCTNLYPLCHELYTLGEDLKFIRDATRGGAAAVLNELCSSRPYGITIEEESIPLDETVASTADILGLSPLEIANEGVFVAVISAGVEEDALKMIKRHEAGRKAALIGRVTEGPAGKVLLETAIGGHRLLDFPSGLLLPRIC